MHKKKLVRISQVVGCWKSDKQVRDVRGHCIDSFKFFAYRCMKQQQTRISLRPFIVLGN